MNCLFLLGWTLKVLFLQDLKCQELTKENGRGVLKGFPMYWGTVETMQGARVERERAPILEGLVMATSSKN